MPFCILHRGDTPIADMEVALMLLNESSRKMSLLRYLTLNLKAQRISNTWLAKHHLHKEKKKKGIAIFLHFGGILAIVPPPPPPPPSLHCYLLIKIPKPLVAAVAMQMPLGTDINFMIVSMDPSNCM